MVILRWYVFCLLVFWLSCQYLPSDWLERLLRERLIVERGSSSQKPRPRSAFDFLGLVYCLIVYLSCHLAQHNNFILLWHNIACLC